jgi:hypothetical protein
MRPAGACVCVCVGGVLGEGVGLGCAGVGLLLWGVQQDAAGAWGMAGGSGQQ